MKATFTKKASLSWIVKVMKRWPTYETLSLTKPGGAVGKDLLLAYSKTKWEEWILSQIMPKNIPVVLTSTNLMLFHMYIWNIYTSHIRLLAANRYFSTINKV